MDRGALEGRVSRPAGNATGVGIAVLGCGNWGKNLARNFHELGALDAVYDVEPAAAEAMHARFGVPVRDFDDILNDSEVSAVAIAAPAALHYRLARLTLDRGKHVFVEKPLALHVPEAENLCELAEASGRVLMVGHLMQYHPAFVRLKEMVEEGQLGRLQYVYSNRLNLGKFRLEEDILWSFAPHDISMILSLIGAEPDEVSAVGSTYLHKTIADVTTTHLTFPGGEGAHIYVSWLHPYKEQRLVVVGDRGMAVFDDGQEWSSKLRIYRHRIDWRNRPPQPVKADSESVPVEPLEPLKMECIHFLDSVAGTHRPRTDGREGVRVLKVLQAASRSMRLAGASPSATEPARPAPHRDDLSIHESAYIDESAEIGKGTRIWHFSHVLAGTKIGRNCSIGQNVMIGPDVVVGNDCKIQNNVSLYKGVILEDGVFCGPSCVFTNVINPRAETERKDEFRPTHVRKGATIGANATILCGHTLGQYSMVGAGAVVTRDVPPHAIVAGVPARQMGWASHAGERLGDDLVCPATGRKYRLVGRDALEEVTG